MCIQGRLPVETHDQAGVEACCVKKRMRDIPETLQDNMGQKMRHS